MTRHPSLFLFTHLHLLILPFFLLSSTAKAWTFVWRNESGPNVAHESNKPVKCERIYHEKGLEFSWDPEGPWCLRIWAEAKCENMIGWECEHTRWRKSASRNMSAYDVYAMPKDAVSKFITETETKTTASLSTSTRTGDEGATTTGDRKASATAGDSKTGASSSASTPTSTDDADSDGEGGGGGGSLSGGAIAGIVVGAVAGVAGLATVFFLWGRRKSKTAPDESRADVQHVDIPEAGPGYPRPTGSSNGPQMTEATTLVASSHSASQYADAHAHTYRPPGSGLPVELPGEMGGVELSNSRQLMEMDGEGYVKRSNSMAKE